MVTESMCGCRVFLVDDHPVIRRGMALLLQQEALTVCGEAENCSDALARLGGACPDVVLVDLNLGAERSWELIGELHARGLRVLVYSMQEDSLSVRRAFTLGAVGYVTKREPVETLVAALREVRAGQRYVSAVAMQALLSGGQDGVEVEFGKLSERELQVLHWMGQGEGSEEIARKLHISPRTVESYYSRIIEKLRLDGMRELRRLAIQQGHEGLPA